MSVAPAGLSSSEVEDEEDEVTREWESLFLFRAEPVQLSKYLQNAKNSLNKCEDPPDLALMWWCFHYTPDDVVHTVDLLVGGNVGLLPVVFVISDLRVRVGRWHARLGNRKETYSQYWNFYIFNLLPECVGFHYLWQVFPGKRFCDLTPDKLAGPSFSLCSHQRRSAVGSSAITHKQWTSTVNLAIYDAIGLTDGDQAALSHRFSVRVLPQITVAVARRGYADVVFVRTVTSQTTITTGTIVMDRL